MQSMHAVAKSEFQLERARPSWVHNFLPQAGPQHTWKVNLDAFSAQVCLLSVSVVCLCLLHVCGMCSIRVCHMHVNVVHLRLLPVCASCLSVCDACVSHLVHFATCTFAQQPKGAIRPPADLQISALSLGPRVQVHRPIQAAGAPVRVAVPCLAVLHHTVSFQSQETSRLRPQNPRPVTCS